jgi:Tfp pilus assembly protein PilF
MFLTTNLLDLNEYARAARICGEHLADASPENGQFLNNCAVAMDATGRADEAERLFRRAIALGEGTNVYANFGRFLGRLGRREEAQAVFEEAIARETGDAMRHVRRGQMLATVHPEDPDAAKAEFEAALRVSPGFRLAIVWLDSLAKDAARRGPSN